MNYRESDDETLLAAWRDDDLEARDHLLERISKGILKTEARWKAEKLAGKGMSDGEDLSQEVLIGLFRTDPKKIVDMEHLRARVRRMARNKSADYYDKVIREPDRFDDLVGPEGGLRVPRVSGTILRAKSEAETMRKKQGAGKDHSQKQQTEALAAIKAAMAHKIDELITFPLGTPKPSERYAHVIAEFVPKVNWRHVSPTANLQQLAMEHINTLWQILDDLLKNEDQVPADFTTIESSFTMSEPFRGYAVHELSLEVQGKRLLKFVRNNGQDERMVKVYMFDAIGCTHSEIAQHLSISERTSNRLLKIAKSHIKSLY